MYFVIILIFILIYLFYRSNSFIDISRFEIEIDRDLKNFDNFKIVQISDLQNNNFNGRLENLVYKENPDIIFVTGDLIDFYNTDEKVAISLISNLIKNFKIFYVSGNHEARVKNYRNFENNLKNLGVFVLNDEMVEYSIENEKINICGIKDPLFASKLNQEEFVKNVLKKFIFKGYSVLLSHRPEHFKIYVENNINLVFSGHAHGGQIQIPFTKRGVFSPNQKIFPKFTNGLYESKNTKMIVSRGLGNSKMRLRLNNPYNLVIVTLKAKK